MGGWGSVQAPAALPACRRPRSMAQACSMVAARRWLWPWPQPGKLLTRLTPTA